MQHFNLPRAVSGAVRADGGDSALFAQIQSTLGDIRNQTDTRLSGIEETVGNLTTSMGAIQQQVDNGGGNPSLQMIDSTIIRAHHCSAGAKGGLRVRVLAAQQVALRPRSISASMRWACP